MPLALLALAIGAFGIGTTEFVITGVLPQVADDFGVSIPAAPIGQVAGWRRTFVLVAVLGVIGYGGVFAAITYTPMVTRVAGYPEGAVTWLLVLSGAGMSLGNPLGAKFADRALIPMLLTTLASGRPRSP